MYSIIIPAYNEERRIRRTLEDYYTYLTSKKLKFEIIVVSDGWDGTGNIVKDFAKNKKNVKLLQFAHRLGKGGAVLEGFKAALGSVVGFTDADNSVRPDDFCRLLMEAEHVDCSVASRRIRGSRIIENATIKRRLLSLLFVTFVDVIFFLGMKDTQCGAKVFRKDLVRIILSNTKTRGFEFDAEVLWHAKRNGYTVKEVPVTWYHSEYSSFKARNIITMFFNLLKVRFGARRI
jgi:glycosyltransferase involved in cell wall biosynthesis